MKDEQLRELLRDGPAPAPDFDPLVSRGPRRAHVRPAIPLAAAAAAALVLVFTLSRPREVPPTAAAGLLDPVVSPLMRGPDLLEGDRIAARIISIRTSEVNP